MSEWTASQPGQCPFCRNWHTGTCPWVAEVEYFRNGLIRRIRFTNGEEREYSRNGLLKREVSR